MLKTAPLIGDIFFPHLENTKVVFDSKFNAKMVWYQVFKSWPDWDPQYYLSDQSIIDATMYKISSIPSKSRRTIKREDFVYWSNKLANYKLYQTYNRFGTHLAYIEESSYNNEHYIGDVRFYIIKPDHLGPTIVTWNFSTTKAPLNCMSFNNDCISVFNNKDLENAA